MMEQCQPANQDTPSNVRDTSLSAKRFGTRSAETIRASSRVRCANRPDTRLHLTDAHISSKMSCYAGAIHTGRSLQCRKNGVCGFTVRGTKQTLPSAWQMAAFQILHRQRKARRGLIGHSLQCGGIRKSTPFTSLLELPITFDRRYLHSERCHLLQNMFLFVLR